MYNYIGFPLLISLFPVSIDVMIAFILGRTYGPSSPWEEELLLRVRKNCQLADNLDNHTFLLKLPDPLFFFYIVYPVS